MVEEGANDMTWRDQLTGMVERLIKDQRDNKKELLEKIDQTEQNLAQRIDRLDLKVFGNGDERAILIRVRDLERDQKYKNEIDKKRGVDIIEMRRTMDNWRSSWKVLAAIGAGAWTIGLIILGIILSHVLQ